MTHEGTARGDSDLLRHGALPQNEEQRGASSMASPEPLSPPDASKTPKGDGGQPKAD